MAKTNNSKLTKEEIQIIKELKDKLFTVDYIEDCMAFTGTILTNAPMALMSAQAHGFLLAVRRMLVARLQKKLGKKT
jgi:glycerol-3-phosphate responsive antiterminator